MPIHKIETLLCGLIILGQAACKGIRSAPSEPMVTQGAEIDESEYPEVVKLRKEPNKICTGTFVLAKPPTLITASHCLPELPAQSHHDTGLSYKGVRALRACLPHGATGSFGPYDLAILVFPANLKVPGLASLAISPPAPGDEVMMIGYGRSDARMTQ